MKYVKSFNPILKLWRVYITIMCYISILIQRQMVCVEEVLKIEKGVERLLILVMIYFNEKNLSNKGRFVECKYCLSQTSDLIHVIVRF